MFDTCATHYCHVLVEDKYYLFNDYIDIIDIDYIVCLYIYIFHYYNIIRHNLPCSIECFKAK